MSIQTASFVPALRKRLRDVERATGVTLSPSAPEETERAARDGGSLFPPPHTLHKELWQN